MGKTANQKKDDRFRKWTREFVIARPRYERFAIEVRALLEKLLSAESIKFQPIESRAKTVDSFRDKVSRPGKEYADPLDEISDLVGVRVILNHIGDIQQVVNLLHKEFDVDSKKSVNKILELGEDRFGYSSVHVVAKLASDRAGLSEWSEFDGVLVEFQVRSVLQHAWATISHELQYKREDDIPLEYRRKLVRVAGMLELADEQFDVVRKLQNELADKLPTVKPADEANQPIDAIRISRFVENSDIAIQLVREARSLDFIYYGYEVEDDDEIERYEKEAFSNLVAFCKIAGLKTIGELQVALGQIAERFLAFVVAAHSTAKDDDKRWYMNDEFVILLAVIAAFPERIGPEDLIEHGFEEQIAMRVHRATAASKKARDKAKH